MGRRAPWLAAAMTVFLLSLAGIPATAGFIGKWWLFAAIIQAGYGWLAVVAALNTAVSLYYYLRVVVKMYMEGVVSEAPYSLTPALAAAVLIAVAAVLAIGLAPARFLSLIEGTAILAP
jgi:NADH-quinone oxidoreductase subunit N